MRATATAVKATLFRQPLDEESSDLDRTFESLMRDLWPHLSCSLNSVASHSPEDLSPPSANWLILVICCVRHRFLAIGSLNEKYP